MILGWGEEGVHCIFTFNIVFLSYATRREGEEEVQDWMISSELRSWAVRSLGIRY